MKIGNVALENNVFLAPMAGVTDLPFRILCKEMGCGLVYSEMVSAKGILYDNKNTTELLEVDAKERPVAVQLFGSDPGVMAQAAETAAGFEPDLLISTWAALRRKSCAAGAALPFMRRPETAQAVVEAAVRAVDIPVTVKIRAGWEEKEKNAVEIAKRCEAAGAAAITVHGRTREQMYAPPVDLEIIRQVKQAVSIPVIGNGDVCDAKSAAQMLEETGCDLVMVGRGALGRPWIFAQISAYLKTGVLLPDPPVAERMHIMIEHIHTLCKYKGTRTGMLQARTHAAWYMKGLHGAAAYRREIGALESMEQLELLACKVIRSQEELTLTE